MTPSLRNCLPALALCSYCSAGCADDRETEPATSAFHAAVTNRDSMEASSTPFYDGGSDAAGAIPPPDGAQHPAVPHARVTGATADVGCGVETVVDPESGELSLNITDFHATVDEASPYTAISCFIRLLVEAPEGYASTLESVRAEASADLDEGMLAGFALATGMSGVPEQFRARQGLRKVGPFADTFSFESTTTGEERRYSRCGSKHDAMLWLALSLQSPSGQGVGRATLTRLRDFKLGVRPCAM